jgi:transcriptional regulator with XRE-family HTH domain
MSITGAQVRMARAALKLGIRELAERAKVSPTTVTAVEAEKDVRSATIEVLEHALEKAGVEFIADGAASDGGGPGLRLAKKKGKR